MDYNVGLNEIVQLMIRTVPPPNENNNNIKPAQKAEKSKREDSNDSQSLVNGHVPSDVEVPVNKLYLNAVVHFALMSKVFLYESYVHCERFELVQFHINRCLRKIKGGNS